MVLGNDGVIKFLKESEKTPAFIHAARDYNIELEALIKGKNYTELLQQIDNYEGDGKVASRKKYTFSMKDLFERLFTNIENVWTATGGVKLYYPDSKSSNEEKKKELIRLTSNVRGGKTLEQWNEAFWMPTYHTDPAGVTFLEYDTEKEIEPFPVYKPITSIRNYIWNGVNLEAIAFEPKTVKTETGEFKEWRVVDDEKDYLVIQKGETFTISEEGTFENPFGKVPGQINSDIIDSDNVTRLSPIHPVIELCKEYLRDKSIKTIFKFMQGFPLFWRYVTQCDDCTGTGKDGTGGKCGTCDGKGYVGRRDVTDTVNIKTPTVDEPSLGGEIAGFINPPLEVWDQYTSELEILEKAIRMTLWGAIIEEDRSNTATGRVIDAQPILQKLNKYSASAEYRERFQTECIANYNDPAKPKDERVSSISYGRNYSLLSASTILELYQNAKEKGDNNTTLDDIFNQYLLARYKNDPISLRLAKIKADVEPYLHYDLDQVEKAFDKTEAQKKMLFDEWWKGVVVNIQTSEQLREEFNTWVQGKLQINTIEE
tara:strand:+ start:3618 stop:5243 length:1626 start_codon:yes stop_codon:yes gene_type:complete